MKCSHEKMKVACESAEKMLKSMEDAFNSLEMEDETERLEYGACIVMLGALKEAIVELPAVFGSLMDEYKDLSDVSIPPVHRSKFAEKIAKMQEDQKSKLTN